MPKRIWNRTFVSLITKFGAAPAEHAHVLLVLNVAAQIMCVIIDVLYYFGGDLGNTYFASWVYGMQHLALGRHAACEI